MTSPTIRRDLGRTIRLLTSALALVLVLGACRTSPDANPNPSLPSATGGLTRTTPGSGSAGGGVPAFTPAPAQWRDCQPSGVQCATVEVPLDYANPGGDKIGLALARMPAGDQSRRIGSLFFNPGGPGASGVEALPSIAASFSREVQDRFDIVAWDPRGVGGSAALTCDRAGLDFYAKDLSTTQTPPDVDAAAREWGASCQRDNGSVLPFVGTRDVALDLESLRQAVGDEKVTYAGFSYGTLIGLVYAELFPTHIRAMILDGVVDPTQDVVESNISQSVAVDEVLARFLDWCRATPARCPLPDARRALESLYRMAHDQPLSGRVQGRLVPLSPTLINFSIVLATYDSTLWPTLARAVEAGLRGDGTLLATLADLYLGSASPSLNVAVNCIDMATPKGEAFDHMVEEAARRAPLTGVYNANSALPCEFWPVPPKPLPTEYRAAGSPPIMVWGTTGDNATPYVNAVKVAGMLDRARLVTLDANRHTALGANRCVTDLQGAYLVGLSLPSDGMRC